MNTVVSRPRALLLAHKRKLQVLAGVLVFYTLFGIATVMESMTLLFVSRIGAGLAGATISTAHAGSLPWPS